jgi:hypothetical protein
MFSASTCGPDTKGKTSVPVLPNGVQLAGVVLCSDMPALSGVQLCPTGSITRPVSHLEYYTQHRISKDWEFSHGDNQCLLLICSKASNRCARLSLKRVLPYLPPVDVERWHVTYRLTTPDVAVLPAPPDLPGRGCLKPIKHKLITPLFTFYIQSQTAIPPPHPQYMLTTTQVLRPDTPLFVSSGNGYTAHSFISLAHVPD